MTDQEIAGVLPHYEGLVRVTSRIVLHARSFGGEVRTDIEFEDIAQELREKLVKALRAYDPRRSRLARDAFVFGAIANKKKDLLKRPHRNEGLTEDLVVDKSPDGFALEYGLVATPDEIYAAIEDDDLMLPSTLTELERRIIVCLYAGRLQTESAAELSLTKGEMERAIRSIRVKLADWRPSPPQGHVPTPPLPRPRASAPLPSAARSS